MATLRLFSWFACGSKNHDLFVPQRDYGVDSHRPTSRDRAGHQRDRSENTYDADQHQGIKGPHTIDFVSHRLLQRRGTDYSQAKTNGHEFRALAQNQSENSRSCATQRDADADLDRKSTRLNSSHLVISYAVFCLKKKKTANTIYCSRPLYYSHPQ